MQSRFTLLVVTSALFAVFVSIANAEIALRQGVTNAANIPKPIMSTSVVVLDVPHMAQGNRPWCVPTSTSMVLKYFGVDVEPAKLKRLAEGHKPENQRNTEFTYWADMQVALRQVGQRWRIRNYAKTDGGFQDGLREIRQALRKGRPVLIDVHLGEGHTFVVIGFNDDKKIVYIRDPLLRSKQVRILSYENLRMDWNDHRFSNSRSAFFSAP